MPLQGKSRRGKAASQGKGKGKAKHGDDDEDDEDRDQQFRDTFGPSDDVDPYDTYPKVWCRWLVSFARRGVNLEGLIAFSQYTPMCFFRLCAHGVHMHRARGCQCVSWGAHPCTLLKALYTGC